MTSRSVLAGACLAFAVLTAAECVPLNEAVSNRDLECQGVPDDICTKLADHIEGQWPPPGEPGDGPIVKVVVEPVDCGVVERQDSVLAGCWEVLATTAILADGSGGSGVSGYYYQLGDGTLIAPNGGVVGR